MSQKLFLLIWNILWSLGEKSMGYLSHKIYQSKTDHVGFLVKYKEGHIPEEIKVRN